ncbi:MULTISPECIES: MFS transporter [Parageobacillus]|uniref:MFS transporter n=1 Tax=Parageobacillus thermoglucosidasius TaxID=1426 RepID=A0A1B7KR26_PARTM|nr:MULTISPECIES: MFS transporter [Parageobacillus]OAT72552.1 MFS transporter [Parageobacillus thermoglucosidasius]BDG45607.1 MFS transporter [Parageobacillus sp. KH3-4]
MLRLFIIFVATSNAFIVLYAPQPLLPLWTQEFDVSIATASLAISLTIISLSIASFLFAQLLDQWNRKKVILSASILLIIPSVMIFLSESFSFILFWRCIYGFIIPGILAMMMAYISEEFPPNQKGRVMGVYVSANVAGGLVGRVISGPIADTLSWRTVFLVIALFSILVAFLVWKYLPKSTFQRERKKKSFIIHFKNPALIGTFAIGFSQFFAFIGFFTYIPFYVDQPPFNLNNTQISLLYATYALGIFSAPIAGIVSDKIGRRWTMCIGHIIGGLGILITLWPTIPALISGSSLLAFGNFASQSATTSYVTDVATTSRGSASSLYLVFFYLGGSLGAWIPGILWDVFGWHGVVFLTVGTIVLALLSNLFLAGKTSWKVKTSENKCEQRIFT